MKITNLPNSSEYINRFFDFLKQKVTSKVIGSEQIFSQIGLVGLYAVGILGAVFFITLTRIGAPVPYVLMMALLSIVGAVVLHYVAFMMLPSLDNLIKNAPTKMSSSGVLKVMALFICAFGAAALIYGIYTAFMIRGDGLRGLFAGLFLFIFSGYWTALLLEPQELNVEIVEKTSVGEEFIGLTSFVAKGCVKLAPIVFGTAIVLAALQLILMIFSYGMIDQQMQSVACLAMSAFLPLIVYIGFLSYFFTLDILTAILKLPEKIDNISKK